MESNWDDKLSLENPDDLFNVIDQFNNIKAVIWGHAHQSSRFIRNGVRTIFMSIYCRAIQWPWKILDITTINLMTTVKLAATQFGYDN